MSHPDPDPKIEDHRIRQRLLETAIEHLERSGYQPGLLARMSLETGYSKEQIQNFFRRSEDVVMALYARFAGDLESRITELPTGTLAERFEAFIRLKIEVIEPYSEAVRGLAYELRARKGRLGVFSSETELIRARVRAMINAVIEGASDNDRKTSDVLTRSLYSIHLAIMWLWLKGYSPRSMERALRAARGLVSFSAPQLNGGVFRLPLTATTAIQDSVLFYENTAALEKGREILAALFRHRRLHRNAGQCASQPCDHCMALHLPKTAYFVSTGRPIHLILPAFPAKSPNRRKTLGDMPDVAEEQALLYLGNVCHEIITLYPAGVRLTICSDGHVFSDLVGVRDDDVARYGAEIKRMIERLGLASMIDTFSLSDLYESMDIGEMRKHLNRHYEQPFGSIRARASDQPQAAEMINGIHRFLLEDAVQIHPEWSRTKARNECRELAYGVVQRSDGWSRLLADCFPMALRLSIHPQQPHSDKIGILLGDAADVWLTPWHSVAVKQNGKFKMMKRYEAEDAGAHLCEGFYELR